MDLIIKEHKSKTSQTVKVLSDKNNQTTHFKKFWLLNLIAKYPSKQKEKKQESKSKMNNSMIKI